MGTLDDVGHKINANLDHNLKYAEERSELVAKLLDKNEEWIIELLSREDVRSKQIKSKNDLLAESQKLDGMLDQIADYILFPRFNNKEEEKHYEYLKRQEKELNRKIKKINCLKKDNQKEEIDKIKLSIKDLKSELELFKKTYLSDSMKNKNKHRERLFGYIDKIEEKIGVSLDDGAPLSSRYNSSAFNADIDDNYWDKMGFSKEGAHFRKEILNTYEDAIENIKRQIGLHIDDQDERNEFVEKLIQQYNDDKIIFTLNDKTRVIDGEERYFKLKKMYGELVSDYNRAKEILTTPISFQSPTPTTTKYNFNNDTWYIDENGDVVEISKNLLLFSNPNTYKGLILNYSDLVHIYEDKFNDDIWAILRTFEDLLSKTDLTNEEKFVIYRLLKGKSRSEIIDEFLDVFHKDISKQVLSNWINRTIPNKITDTYLNYINEWVYTYKIKGKYKKCSSCGEIKTINNDRYFRKDMLGRDGFRSNCRNCEVLAKNVDK